MVSVSPELRLISPDASIIDSAKAQSVVRRKPSLPKIQHLKRPEKQKTDKRPQPPSNSLESCKYQDLTSRSTRGKREYEQNGPKPVAKPKVPTLRGLRLSPKTALFEPKERSEPSFQGKI